MKCTLFALALVGVLSVGSAAFGAVDEIHPVGASTSDPIAYGDVDFVIDGVINVDQHVGMGTPGLGTWAGPYTILFDLGDAYDLTGMTLRNNGGTGELDGEGIDGFNLHFLDAAMSPLGTFGDSATDTLAPQQFSFSAADVSHVELEILSAHSTGEAVERGYALFHEISFVPEPATLALLTLGVFPLLRRRTR